MLQEKGLVVFIQCINSTNNYCILRDFIHRSTNIWCLHCKLFQISDAIFRLFAKSVFIALLHLRSSIHQLTFQRAKPSIEIFLQYLDFFFSSNFQPFHSSFFMLNLKIVILIFLTFVMFWKALTNDVIQETGPHYFRCNFTWIWNMLINLVIFPTLRRWRRYF